MEKFDIIVIGAGGGTKIALPAAAMGLKTAFIEKAQLGGTCLNRGCIPSKILIHPADVLCAIEHARHLNIQTDANPEVDFSGLIDRVQRDVRDIVDHLDRTIGHKDGLELIRGHAHFTDNHTIAVDGRLLTAPRIFLATGSRPWIPDIPGLATSPYMTSTDALTNRSRPARMAVLGAGYIACELGHAYGTLGSKVHFLVRSSLLRHEDPEIQREFDRIFSRRHTLHRNCLVTHVAHDGQQFNLSLSCGDENSSQLSADALLVATGVVPCTDDLGIENTSIALTSGGHIQVNDYLETSVPGIWALGDCIGRYLFRHSVNREGEYLVDQVLRQRPRAPLNYGAMPHAVFTYPQIAGAGATEDELEDRQIDYVVGRAAYADTSMGLARRSEHGLVKLLIERHSRRILGAHIIGDEAATMLHTLIALLYKDGTLDDLLEMVFIHPALPEAIRDAARHAHAQCATI